jgi:hypothetical protein
VQRFHLIISWETQGIPLQSRSLPDIAFATELCECRPAFMGSTDMDDFMTHT